MTAACLRAPLEIVKGATEKAKIRPPIKTFGHAFGAQHPLAGQKRSGR
jgi:hypothetical protein